GRVWAVAARRAKTRGRAVRARAAAQRDEPMPPCAHRARVIEIEVESAALAAAPGGFDDRAARGCNVPQFDQIAGEPQPPVVVLDLFAEQRESPGGEREA